LGRPLEITKDNLGSLISLAPKTIREKRRQFLQALVRKVPGYGLPCPIDANADFPYAYVRSSRELLFVLQHLKDKKLITLVEGSGSQREALLTAQGWQEVEEVHKPAALREKAFVAMWFQERSGPAFREGIAPAIEESGYRPIRIDLEEHSDSVIDRIFAEIKEARFVVADFTGHRMGVYFAAAFARGLGLDVIWTCNADEFGKRHFDVHGFNMIVWTTPTDLRERLKARIRAIVGCGPIRDQLTPP
jgi:hypothetical protein